MFCNEIKIAEIEKNLKLREKLKKKNLRMHAWRREILLLRFPKCQYYASAIIRIFFFLKKKLF